MSHPYRSAKRLPGARTDFRTLWSRLRAAYSLAGRTRMVAVLDNFKDRKETICRRLNVVCDADVNRISESLKARGKSSRTKGSATDAGPG